MRTSARRPAHRLVALRRRRHGRRWSVTSDRAVLVDADRRHLGGLLVNVRITCRRRMARRRVAWRRPVTRRRHSAAGRRHRTPACSLASPVPGLIAPASRHRPISSSARRGDRDGWLHEVTSSSRLDAAAPSQARSPAACPSRSRTAAFVMSFHSKSLVTGSLPRDVLVGDGAAFFDTGRRAAGIDDPGRALPLRLGQGGAREGEPAQERRRPRRRLGARCGRARRRARGARRPDARASCAQNPVVPYEQDELTRIVEDDARRPGVSARSRTSRSASSASGCSTSRRPARRCARSRPGLTPEMAAAACKLMSNFDLMTVGAKCQVVVRANNTLGLPGRLSSRCQPNHPTDDVAGHPRVDARGPLATAAATR